MDLISFPQLTDELHKQITDYLATLKINNQVRASFLVRSVGVGGWLKHDIPMDNYEDTTDYIQDIIMCHHKDIWLRKIIVVYDKDVLNYSANNNTLLERFFSQQDNLKYRLKKILQAV